MYSLGGESDPAGELSRFDSGFEAVAGGIPVILGGVYANDKKDNMLTWIVREMAENGFDSIASYFDPALGLTAPVDFSGKISIGFSLGNVNGAEALIVRVRDNGAGRSSASNADKVASCVRLEKRYKGGMGLSGFIIREAVEDLWSSRGLPADGVFERRIADNGEAIIAVPLDSLEVKDGGILPFGDAESLLRHFSGENSGLSGGNYEPVEAFLGEVWPELISDAVLKKSLAEFLLTYDERAITAEHISSARGFLRAAGRGRTVLDALRSKRPQARVLLQLLFRVCLAAGYDAYRILPSPDSFYFKEAEKINKADFSSFIRSMNNDYGVNLEFLEVIIDQNFNADVFFQAVLHEIGHNIMRSSYTSGAWYRYSNSAPGGRQFMQIGEFFADDIAERSMASVGSDVRDFYRMVHSGFLASGAGDEEHIHTLARYARERLRADNALDSFDSGSLLDAVTALYPPDIQGGIRAPSDGFWGLLARLGVYDSERLETVKEGFGPWLRAYTDRTEYRKKYVESSRDGGAAKAARSNPGGIDFRELSPSGPAGTGCIAAIPRNWMALLRVQISRELMRQEMDGERCSRGILEIAACLESDAVL